MSLLTTTSTGPLAPAGVSQVIEVSLTVTTLVAALPSKVTVLVPGELLEKPVPVIVTLVPPVDGPVAGETELTVGAGW